MKNKAPKITEEHIVAWLDGELSANGIASESLDNPAAFRAAREHAAINAAFEASAADKRFVLPASLDARVRASLAKEISTTRKTPRTPAAMPAAAPIPGNRQNDLKKIWIRRSSYALALLLLVGLWFGLNQNKPQQIAEVSAPSSTPQGESAAPAITAPSNQTQQATEQHVAEAPVTHTTEPAANHRQSVHQDIAVTNTPVTPVITNAPQPAPAAEQSVASNTEEDRAAIMISHRYAKLIKATPAVEVSQQDKMKM